MSDYLVVVKPGSKKGPLVETGEGGVLAVYVRERAVEGRANEAVIALLAAHLGVAKSRIALVRGQSSRYKFIKIL